jgi:anti-sigma B factor antagonist
VSLPASILVGVAGKTVHVKVQGKGSFQNSPALKEFARQMLDRGYRVFVIDLADCPVMDSTFMGTLAGIALRLRETEGGVLRVRNVNERNHDLLRNLGLDNLFQIEACEDREAVSEPAMLPNRPAISKSEHAECMIEAHEALVDADPENLARFKDVLEYLRHDLRTGSTK